MGLGGRLPTFVTHAVVGFSLSAVVFSKPTPRLFWVMALVVPIVADFDVIAFALGIPYADFWGHRGFFHSLLFGAVFGLLVAASLLWRYPNRYQPWKIMLLFVGLGCSHPVLDACTNGGLGVALLSPFDDTRIFMPFRPIRVSPISLRSFFSQAGLSTLLSEALWVWLPMFFLVVVSQRKHLFRIRPKRPTKPHDGP